MTVNCDRRVQAVSSPQALTLMNGEFALREAKGLAERLRKETAADYARETTDPIAAEFPRPGDLWSYGHGSFDDAKKRTASFTPLPHFSGSYWQGGPAIPDPTVGYVLLHAAGGHAGTTRPTRRSAAGPPRRRQAVDLRQVRPRGGLRRRCARTDRQFPHGPCRRMDGEGQGRGGDTSGRPRGATGRHARLRRRLPGRCELRLVRVDRRAEARGCRRKHAGGVEFGDGVRRSAHSHVAATGRQGVGDRPPTPRRPGRTRRRLQVPVGVHRRSPRDRPKPATSNWRPSQASANSF